MIIISYLLDSQLDIHRCFEFFSARQNMKFKFKKHVNNQLSFQFSASTFPKENLNSLIH